MKTFHWLLWLLVCGLASATLVLSEDVKFIRIVDGDTLKVTYNGRKETLRLIGIDTPEANMNEKTLRDARRSHENTNQLMNLGHLASQHTESLLINTKSIKIEFDVGTRDKFGRLLAYVYLPDGGMLNEKLIRDGYAKPYTIPPNVRYATRFKKALEDARQHRRGLWALDQSALSQ